MDFKKFLPERSQLQQYKAFRIFGNFIHDGDLWHMNEKSVPEAFFWGAICCFMPIPFQMVPCLLFCIWRRCNVPIAIAIVWISNPITMGPMMYFAYEVGAWMTGEAATFSTIELSLDWMLLRLKEIWLPLIVGCATCGLVSGLIGYAATYFYWHHLRSKSAER